MKYLLLICSVGILLVSCKKEKKEEQPPLKVLFMITESTPADQLLGMYYFKHNTDGELTRMSYRYYMAGPGLDSFYSAIDRTGWMITKITSRSATDPVPAEYYVNYHLSTDLVEHIIKMHNGRKDSFHLTPNSPPFIDQFYRDPATQQLSQGNRTVFDFNFGNLREINVLPPNSAIAVRRTQFKYDSKKSPFKTSINEIILTEGQFGDIPIGLFNNVVEKNIDSPAGSFSPYKITTTYTYNDDGTPATALVTNHLTNNTRKFLYHYK